jgi:mRNA-degrading endonuclease RelE of RelBE toxin-antitoxin system
MVANRQSEDDWTLVVHKVAAQDVLWLKKNRPDIFQDIIDQLHLLAKYPDPRKHPRVKPLKWQARGWYRLALYRYNYRVAFRLLHAEDTDEYFVEIWPREEMPDEGDFYLQVVRVAPRACIYSHELDRRWRVIEKVTR